MPVQIHGKDYKTVAERVAEIREGHPEWTIETQLIFHDDEKVIMKALLMDGERLVATGYAEELRAASQINALSAVECCETSAVGRAASFAGYSGTEIASADEVANAIKGQAAMELVNYNSLVREYFYEIAEVKSALEPKWGPNENQSDVTHARALLKDLGDDVYRGLWKAPTKGGIFTTHERSLLKEPPEDAL
jgi:hypothetical protein